MTAPGFNPLRWNCKARGECFNVKKRPKIEVFAECFPRRISFGDVDGVIEINGFGLFLEWKESNQQFSTGQRLLWQRLTASKQLMVLCVAGDAETMVVTHRAAFALGKFRPWQPSTLDDVKDRLRAWVEWTNRQRRKDLRLVG